MKWEYRICKTAYGYSLREVYGEVVDGKLVPESWTDPVEFGGESAGEVQRSLAMALRDALCSPVFELP